MADNGEHACSICGDTFDTEEELEEHAETEHDMEL